MTKIDEFNYGKAIYVDCMDGTNGLPSIKNNSIDLALTDPPYNVKYKGRRDTTKKNKDAHYEDNMTYEEYKEWCRSWYKELRRICKCVIITPGNVNLWMWKEIEVPVDYGFNYKKDSMSIASKSYLNLFDVFIIYGELPSGRKLHRNVIESPTSHPDTIHPCPKPVQFFRKIIEWLQPKSVIDPFLGSGTTGLICEKLQIEWIGFEKNEKYAADINNKLSGARPIKKINDYFIKK